MLVFTFSGCTYICTYMRVFISGDHFTVNVIVDCAKILQLHTYTYNDMHKYIDT